VAKLPLIPVDLPPGIVKNGTQYQVKGRWYDASQVRWFSGVMQPIGGWGAITTSPLAHPARGMLAWTTNAGSRFYAVGTSAKLIVGDGSSTTWDITPAGYTAGSDNAFEEIGYGGTTYGQNTYGTPIHSGVYLPPTTWDFDLWGDNLVAVANTDGVAYQWALGTGTPAAAISGAPVNNKALLVTEQEHLMLLGAGGNRRLVQWSDKTNNTVWTPSTTNEAGQFPLTTAGNLLCGVRVAQQALIFTDVDAWAGTYIGQPFIFGFNKVGDKCGPLSSDAVALAGGNAYWMSDKRFWTYNGSTVQEVPCDVANYVFPDINPGQYGKVAAGTNAAFEEVWWHYPSLTSNEPDKYVAYNYAGNFWMVGKLGRTAWIDKGAFPTPMAVGSDGYIYNHETGTLANGASRTSVVYATSGALEPEGVTGGVGSPYAASGGGRITEVNQIITDEKTLGDLNMTFTTRFTPNGPTYTFGPYSALTRGDGYVDTRIAGRQIVMTVTPATDNTWELGQMRWDAQATSGR
jgi:hypothetical protein